MKLTSLCLKLEKHVSINDKSCVKTITRKCKNI